ncbi:MAG: hypothetical protein JWP96_517 [Polaromonas sp.]|nr:hypothetical protein [Polaromonas sp.]
MTARAIAARRPAGSISDALRRKFRIVALLAMQAMKRLMAQRKRELS